MELEQERARLGSSYEAERARLVTDHEEAQVMSSPSDDFGEIFGFVKLTVRARKRQL